MKKRIISITLIIAILCASTQTLAFANSTETPVIQSVVFDDGTLYSAEFHDLLTVLLIPGSGDIEISFSYKSNPADVYQFFITDRNAVLSNDDVVIWPNVYTVCHDNVQNAVKMTFTITTDSTDASLYNSSSENAVYSILSSVNEDLDEDLAAIHGDEYGPNNKYSTVSFGPTITVKETMKFLYVDATPFWWNVEGVAALSVTSFVTGCLGLAATSTILAAVAYIFEVASYVDEQISPSGSLNRYLCSVRIRRHTSVNGSEYEYTYVDHIYQYYAYENPDLNSDGRAAVVPYCENEYYYYDGMNYGNDSSYFNSYSSQVADAYDRYLVIGQMD